jgi:dUTP pyrophosphatase
MKIKLKRLNKDAKIPTHAHTWDAGLDLYSVEDVVLRPGEIKRIRSGWAFEIPEGYYVEIYNRSGLSSKNQVVIISSRIIDSPYRGEIFVPMKNIGDQIVSIMKNTKYAQIILKKRIDVTFEEVDELSETDRGSGGFGSTGV